MCTLAGSGTHHTVTKFYSYISSGCFYSWVVPGGKGFGSKYGTGDIVTMIYNPNKSTLVFFINEQKQGIII